MELPLTPRVINALDGNPVNIRVGDNVTALSNTSITIECPNSGIPKPTVTWTKEGVEVVSDEKFTIEADGSLVINGVDGKDNARFTCTANSSAGRDRASSTLQIIGKVHRAWNCLSE